MAILILFNSIYFIIRGISNFLMKLYFVVFYSVFLLEIENIRSSKILKVSKMFGLLVTAQWKMNFSVKLV